MSVEISVVIPAYNEEARLPRFLPTVVAHLERTFPNEYEIIVANDGSTDGTLRWLMNQELDWRRVAILTLESNRGKGAAVREGVGQSKGRLVLYCDADGAAPIEEERRLREAIESGADVAVGSRAVSSPGVTVHRPASRRIAGRLFIALAQWTLRPPVRDTQCGFKMFRGEVARRIANAATEDGYLFDLEWLALAQCEGCKILEVGVNWTEMPGSKLSVSKDALKVLKSLIGLRRRLKERT